jgi:predicted MFS family arabinose efflux permease
MSAPSLPIDAAALGSTDDPKPALATWLAVLSVGTGAFALVTTEFLPVGLLPAMARDLGVTEGQAGLTVTMPGILAAIAAPALTVATGRLDRRIVLWVLMGLLLISNVLVAVAPSFVPLLVGRLLLGFGVGGFWAIGVAIGPKLVPPAYAIKATSLIFAGVSLGTVAGVPAGALIGDLFGWRAAFAAAGVVAIVVLAVFAVPKARIGLLATLLIFLGQFAAYTYVTPFLVQVTGMNAGGVTTLLLAYGIAGFIGNSTGAWIANRDVGLAVTIAAGLIGATTLALPLWGESQLAATIIVGVWGLAFGALPISIQSWMFRAAPDALESGAALFVAIAQVALASGALVGGLAVDHAGVPSAMILGGGFAVATALLIGLFGRQRGTAVA